MTWHPVSLLTKSILTALVTFCVVFFGTCAYRYSGLLARSQSSKCLLIIFSGAIFFNMTFLHLIPESSWAFHICAPRHSSFPFAYLFTMLGFILGIVVTKLAIHPHGQHHSSARLVEGLTVHVNGAFQTVHGYPDQTVRFGRGYPVRPA